MSIIETAKSYAERGWMIVPIPFREKGPRLKGWQNLRISPETVPFTGLEDGKHNIGLLMGDPSKLVCVDIDHPLAKELASFFLPATGLVTGRQGNPASHWFYQCTDAGHGKKFPIPKQAGVEHASHHTVELLSTGQQVVVGPSVHESGDTYDTLQSEPSQVAFNDLMKCCQALHKAVLAKLGIDDQPEKPKPAKREPSSQTTFAAGPSLREALDQHGATILAEGATNDGCKGYYVSCPNEALHSTKTSQKDCMVWTGPSGGFQAKCFHASCGIDSWQSFRTALNPGWQSQAERAESVDLSGLMNNGHQHADDDDDEGDDEQYGLPFPGECLEPPGLIGEIVRHNLATAKYPQPEHALAGALALMSLVTGRRVQDSQGTRTNLMIVALGPTRSGKEHPRQINKKILEHVQRAELYEEKIASHSALHGFLKQANVGLLMNDEFGDFLALARSTKGANTQPAQIISAMIKLYSSSGSNYKADRYADNAKQIEIDQPHLVLYGTSTGEVFWKHVTPEYLSGGLFGRVMLFENRGYVDPVPLSADRPILPEVITKEVDWWLSCFSHRDMLFWEHPVPVIVPHTPEARERFEAHELDISTKRKNETPIRAALWSGTGEITAKLALLFACSRSRNPLQIEKRDVDLAVKLSNWLTRRKVELSQDNVAENLTETQAKRIFRLVKSAGKKGLSKSQIIKKTQWIKKRERDELLNDLLLCGKIFTSEISTEGRSIQVFHTSRTVQS